MIRGIMAMDCGGHTGVAWCLFDPNAKTVKDALQSKFGEGSMTITGTIQEQINELVRGWNRFLRNCVIRGRMEPDWVELVFEDFVLRPNAAPGSEAVLSPKIAWGIEGYRMGQQAEYENGGWGPTLMTPAIWQQPGPAKNFATDARLKDWGCWIKGREHERDAWRHVALRIANLMREKGKK